MARIPWKFAQNENLNYQFKNPIQQANLKSQFKTPRYKTN